MFDNNKIKGTISLLQMDVEKNINLCLKQNDASYILTSINALEFGLMKSMTVIDSDFPKTRNMKLRYNDGFYILTKYDDFHMETKLTCDQLESLKQLCIEAVFYYVKGMHIDFEDAYNQSYSYTIEYIL